MPASKCVFLLMFLPNIIITGTVAETPEEYINHRKELNTFLTDPKRYDRTVRPVHHHMEITGVHIALIIETVLEMEPESNILALNAYLGMIWYDDQLSWDPSKYGGIRYTHVPPDKIWTPRIREFQTAYGGNYRTWNNVYLNFDGNVFWWRKTTIYSTCSMDLRNFPFDEHKCIISIGSSAEDGETMDVGGYIEISQNNLSYVDKAEWILMNTSVKKEKLSMFGHDDRPVVDFVIEVKRRSTNYVYTIVIPAAVVALMTLLMFWLPPPSYKKLTLGGTNLFVITMLLNYVSSTLKGSQSVPRITIFLGNSMMVIGVATLLELVIINIVRSPMPIRPPSSLLRLLSEGAGRVLLLCVSLEEPDALEDKLMDDGQLLNREAFNRRQEWSLVCQAVDRLLFVLFFFIIVVVSI